jgi:predicted ATP-binding protein involved in virulence
MPTIDFQAATRTTNQPSMRNQLKWNRDDQTETDYFSDYFPELKSTPNNKLQQHDSPQVEVPLLSSLQGVSFINRCRINSNANKEKRRQQKDDR